MMRNLNPFAASFQFEADHELPGTGSEMVFYYPGAHHLGAGPGSVCKVIPDRGPAYFVHCSEGTLGNRTDSLACTCPNPNHLCVISAGLGYIINVHEPQDWFTLPTEPIIDFTSDTGHDVLVFADYTDLCCLSKNGLRWKSGRISYDGFRNLLIRGESVSGEAYSAPQDDWVPFEVDLANGRCKGGAF